MYVCVTCKRKMRCDKNGVGADFGNGHVYPGDRYECDNCGYKILATTGVPILDLEHKSQHEYLEMAKVTQKICNVSQLAHAVGVITPGLIRKAIYKGTECGAWINFREDGVDIGSIVEGVNECTDTIKLDYEKFTDEDFWQALKKIEQQAKEIWDRTHGCDDCSEEIDENGNRPINPDCPTCKGEGIII